MDTTQRKNTDPTERSAKLAGMYSTMYYALYLKWMSVASIRSLFANCFAVSYDIPLIHTPKTTQLVTSKQQKYV